MGIARLLARGWIIFCLFAAAFTWLLAIIYLGSAVSRLKLTAGLMRLERAKRPEILGPTVRAFPPDRV